MSETEALVLGNYSPSEEEWEQHPYSTLTVVAKLAPPILHKGTTAKAGCPLLVYAGHNAPSYEESQTHWIEAADRYGLATVIYDFSTPPAPSQWISMLQTLIPQWTSKLGADPNKVYLAGFSAGATKAQSVGEDKTVKIAGIIPASGWRYRTDNFTRTAKCRYMAFYGKSGDVQNVSADKPGVPTTVNKTFEDLRVTAAHYAKLCGNPTGWSVSPAKVAGYTNLNQWYFGPDVVVYEVTNEGHAWPGQPGMQQTVKATDIAAKWILAG